MNAKDFFKPSFFKIAVFAFFSVIFLYLAKETVSAIGLSFAIFYSAYGFPFQYLITGDIGSLSGIINAIFLGNYFGKYGNFLFNPFAFLLDIVLIYSLSCFISFILRKKKNQ